MVIRELLAFASGLLRGAQVYCAGARVYKNKGRRESDLLVDIVQ